MRGPGQVDDVLSGGKRLPAEIQAYVARVDGPYWERLVAQMVLQLMQPNLTRPDGSSVLIDPISGELNSSNHTRRVTPDSVRSVIFHGPVDAGGAGRDCGRQVVNTNPGWKKCSCPRHVCAL